MSTAVAVRDERALAVDPVGFMGRKLAEARAWLADAAHTAEELRLHEAWAAGMEALTRQLDDATEAERHAAEIRTLVRGELAKLADHPGQGARTDLTSTPSVEVTPKVVGKRATEDKALAKATPEQIDQAIAEVRAEERLAKDGGPHRMIGRARDYRAATGVKIREATVEMLHQRYNHGRRASGQLTTV